MRAPSASVLPAVSVASLVGFGAVIASLPAFAAVRDWVLAIEGSPLVSLAVATNVLAALTGWASGGIVGQIPALAGPRPFVHRCRSRHVRKPAACPRSAHLAARHRALACSVILFKRF